MDVKIRRSLFGLNRRRVQELLDKKDAEHLEELTAKLDEIEELKHQNAVRDEQIERYKKNESFMTDTLVEVMERAETAELKQKNMNERLAQMRAQLLALNDEYAKSLQRLQAETEEKINAILRFAEETPVLESKEKPALPQEQTAEADSEEEYRFHKTLRQEETELSADAPQGEKNEEEGEEKEGDGGFDMKEAVTPKQRLDEICRELGLI
ncbi:MAG: hypothetical protein KIG36_00465 [Eubacteriales bacterium]|nr:hypothetical protein [Eubacteriales bacterium]